MEKPSTMSVKEWIIKKMSINMVISEKTIDQVINHQFDSANDALNTNDTVEISGFGKFLFNKKKHSTQLRLNTALTDIKTLKPKMNESKTDI